MASTNLDNLSLHLFLSDTYCILLLNLVGSNLFAGGEGDDEEDLEPDASATVTAADAILRDCRYNLHVSLMASNRCLKAGFFIVAKS